MTYFKDAETAVNESPVIVHPKCMGCGKTVTGSAITHDLITPETGGMYRALFHRDCAFAMAQRIICDAWPNRRDGGMMENNR